MRPLNRPMFRYGGPIKEGIMSGIKDNRVPFDQGGYLSNLLAKTGALFNPLKKFKPVQKFIQRQKIEFPPARVPSKGMGGVQLTDAQIKAGMGTTGVPFLTRAKQFASLNPKLTYGAAPFVVSGAVTATPTIVEKGLKGAGAVLAQASPIEIDKKTKKPKEGVADGYYYDDTGKLYKVEKGKPSIVKIK